MQRFAIVSCALEHKPNAEKKAKFPQQGETEMKPKIEINDDISGHGKEERAKNTVGSEVNLRRLPVGKNKTRFSCRAWVLPCGEMGEDG